MEKVNRRTANRILMNRIKVERGCAFCGYNANPVALQFDHIDPDTKFRNGNGKLVNPSDMVGYSQVLVIAELAKCRVLCANCHMVYTHDEQRKK
jgi:hypothetical protein